MVRTQWWVVCCLVGLMDGCGDGEPIAEVDSSDAAFIALAAGAPCDNIDCGENGICYDADRKPNCLCDEGYHAEELFCVPLEAEIAVRNSSTPAQQRAQIIAIAIAENGRGPQEVGKSVIQYPHDLGRYLEPKEAWCSEFVAWVYKVVGVPFTGGSEGGWMLGGNKGVRAWFQKRTKWIDRNNPDWDTFVPLAGDFMRLETSGGGHSAIVREVKGTTLLTVEGNVSNRVKLREYKNYRANQKIDGFGMRTERNNEAPIVLLDSSAAVVLPTPLTLQAELSDDGLPNESLTLAWSQANGPGSAVFSNAAVPNPSVTFSEPGQYVLALTADDGDKQTTANITVTVIENQAPTVQIGADRTVLLGSDTVLTLEAIVLDDGYPDRQLTLQWQQHDGPAGAEFSLRSAETTTVRFTDVGLYKLGLTASDGDKEGEDTVLVTVRDPQSTAVVPLDGAAPEPLPSLLFPGCSALAGDRVLPMLCCAAVFGLLLRNRRRKQSVVREVPPQVAAPCEFLS